MNLWIRSQNKIDLIKVDDVCYCEIIVGEHTLWFRDIALGIYKTKERALEVLDEIQRTLTYQRHKIPASNLGDTKNNYLDIQTNYVYEMPEK